MKDKTILYLFEEKHPSLKIKSLQRKYSLIVADYKGVNCNVEQDLNQVWGRLLNKDSCPFPIVKGFPYVPAPIANQWPINFRDKAIPCIVLLLCMIERE